MARSGAERQRAYVQRQRGTVARQAEEIEALRTELVAVRAENAALKAELSQARFFPYLIASDAAVGSAAVPQSCGNSVDSQVDAGDNIFTHSSCAIAFQQFDLHVIERIEIRKAVAD